MNFLLSLGESVVFNPLKLKRISTPIINRIFLSICFLMLISFQTYGQDKWTLLNEEIEGLQVYINIDHCGEINLSDIELQSTEKLKLKFVNNTDDFKNIEYFRIIKSSGNSNSVSLTIPSGTTEITSCDQLPLVQLTMEEGDGYPISMTDYFELFSINIK